jgi:hypothetical protein
MWVNMKNKYVTKMNCVTSVFHCARRWTIHCRMSVTQWPAQDVSESFKLKELLWPGCWSISVLWAHRPVLWTVLFREIFICCEVFCWCERIHIFVSVTAHKCTPMNREQLAATSFQNLQKLVLTLHTWIRLDVYYFVRAFQENCFCYHSFRVMLIWGPEICAQFGYGWTGTLSRVSSFVHVLKKVVDCQIATRWGQMVRGMQTWALSFLFISFMEWVRTRVNFDLVNGWNGGCIVRQPEKLHVPDHVCMLTNGVYTDLLLLEMYHNSQTFCCSCHTHVTCKLLEKGRSICPQQYRPVFVCMCVCVVTRDILGIVNSLVLAGFRTHISL